jgi:4-hydroxybenzoate polyprenyltransferase
LNLLKRPSKLRVLLVLGRVSNLPTVWSNCLAGWWLGGAGRLAPLLGVSLCASLLYIGGMFLNDAFDAEFDRHNRRTRPIPSGAMSERAVWRWGFAWMALGLGGMILEGKTAFELSLALAALILIYNALHKLVPFAPVLMGGCRLLLYLAAAATGQNGVTGEAIWKGLALGSYVVGLSCLARKETSRRAPPLWPGLLLAAPLLLAVLVDNGPAWKGAVIFSVVLALWSCWALGRSRPGAGHIGLTVSSLLAGVVLVDLLAVAEPGFAGLVFFVLCFVSALFLQRSIPAT